MRPNTVTNSFPYNLGRLGVGVVQEHDEFIAAVPEENVGESKSSRRMPDNVAQYVVPRGFGHGSNLSV